MNIFHSSPKKILLTALYLGLIAGLIAGGVRLYQDQKDKKTGNAVDVSFSLPPSQSAQDAITNFYSAYNKNPNSHNAIVRANTTPAFQTKYNKDKNLDAVTCGNKTTSTFTVEESYKDKDDTVYRLVLQYQDVGSQASIYVKVSDVDQSHLINDVICTDLGEILNEPKQ